MYDGSLMDALCNTGDGVFIVDENKQIVRWNKAAESLLKHSESEVLNLKCYQVISGKTMSDSIHCQPDCRIHQAVKTTPQKNFNIKTQTKDGKTIWINMSIISSPVNGKRFVAHILRDISNEKIIESGLNRLLVDLGINGQIQDRLSLENQDNPPLNKTDIPSKKASNILSGREIEVLTLLAEGLPTKSLAQKLNISHFTARNHIQNILAKLGLHSKAQAVSYAFKKGIL